MPAESLWLSNIWVGSLTPFSRAWPCYPQAWREHVPASRCRARSSSPDADATGSFPRSHSGAIEAVVLEFILPLPHRAEDIESWVDRFILVFSSVSDASQQSLLRLTNLAHLGERRLSPYKRFVVACQENNVRMSIYRKQRTVSLTLSLQGGIIDDNEEVKKRQLNTIIDFLSKSFPDPKRARDDLHKFARMNESRLYSLLKTLLDPQTDLRSLLKTYVRVEDQGPCFLLRTEIH